MYVFEINNFGINSLKEKTKEFYEMLIAGVVFYFLLFLATVYTIDNEGVKIFFINFLTLLYFFIFIFTPITLIVRVKKVIRKLQIDESNILLETNKEIWFCINDIKVKAVRNKFTGFSIRNKDGLFIIASTGKEYWIIEDFFNNYEDLKTALMKTATMPMAAEETPLISSVILR